MRRISICILSLLLVTGTASGCNNIMPDGMATVQVTNLRFGDPNLPSEVGKAYYDATVLDADPALPSSVQFVTPYHRGGGMTHITLEEGTINTVGMDIGMVVCLTYVVKGEDRLILDYNLLLPEDRKDPPKSSKDADDLMAALQNEVAKGATSWTLVGVTPEGNTGRILVAYDEGKVLQNNRPWTRWSLIKKNAPTTSYAQLKTSWRDRE
jgi:hypothetical protein